MTLFTEAERLAQLPAHPEPVSRIGHGPVMNFTTVLPGLKAMPHGSYVCYAAEQLDAYALAAADAREAAVLQKLAEQEPFWHAVVSKKCPVINKAIRRGDVAQEYADKINAEGYYSGAEVVPLYTHPAPVAQSGWQSIETAPKDGRKLMLCYRNCAGKARTVLARWLTDDEAAETDDDGVGLEGGWYECIDNWDDYTEVAINQGEPTDWMPLPASPADENTLTPTERAACEQCGSDPHKMSCSVAKSGLRVNATIRNGRMVADSLPTSGKEPT